MRHKLSILMTMLILISSTACAEHAWETGQMPYLPEAHDLSGVVCWSSSYIYKGSDTIESFIHFLDLSTGEETIIPADDRYLIYSDNGVMAARERDGILEIAEWTDDHGWTNVVSYPFTNDYEFVDHNKNIILHQSVVAFKKGWLYYYVFDNKGNKVLCRDDMSGFVYRYKTDGNACEWMISDDGIVCFGLADTSEIFEYPTGGIRTCTVSQDRSVSFRPVLYLDDDKLLAWTKDNNTSFLIEYDIAADKYSPYYDRNNNIIENRLYGEGVSGCYNPDSELIVQLAFVGEDYFNCVSVLDLRTGETTVVAETVHTDQFDEYCSSYDRVVWMKSK